MAKALFDDFFPFWSRCPFHIETFTFHILVVLFVAICLFVYQLRMFSFANFFFSTRCHPFHQFLRAYSVSVCVYVCATMRVMCICCCKMEKSLTQHHVPIYSRSIFVLTHRYTRLVFVQTTQARKSHKFEKMKKNNQRRRGMETKSHQMDWTIGCTHCTHTTTKTTRKTTTTTKTTAQSKRAEENKKNRLSCMRRAYRQPARAPVQMEWNTTSEREYE